MTHHSKPAEAVARALREHFGTSSTTTFTAREAGRQAASVALRHLSASPAPAAGVEAVREIEAIFRRHLQANDYAKDLIKRIAFDVVPAVRKALSAALASPAATACNLVPPPETYGGSVDDPWTGRMPASPAVTRGEPVAWQRFHPSQGKWIDVYQDDIEHYRREGQHIRPLYATPPAPAESARVKVKPLEWVKHPSANIWRAECLLGVYQLYNVQTPVWLFDGFTDRVHDKRADSVDAGFAAAQADYEARIRASLATDAKE